MTPRAETTITSKLTPDRQHRPMNHKLPLKAGPEKPGPSMCFPDPQATLGRAASIADTRVPPSLHQQDDPSMPVQKTSGRDSSNSSILYWEEDPANRPAYSAKCWLYHAPGRAWTRD